MKSKKKFKFIEIIKSDKKIRYFTIYSVLILFISVIGFSLSFYTRENYDNAVNFTINGLSYLINTNDGASDDRILELDVGKIEKFAVSIISKNTVDTKYEFGKLGDEIILIDEIHTPDSSRYFYAEGYEQRQANGEKQRQLSKEFVREWLMENGFQGKEGQKVPEMTDEIVNNISERYMELYEQITGEKFIKRECPDVLKSMEENISKALKELR